MSPLLELQGAIVPRLKAYAPLTALVSTRVYNAVPADRAYPCVSIGPADETQDDADCIETSQVIMQIDVWSQSPGSVEALKVAEEVRNALHRYALTIGTNALVEIAHRQTIWQLDPDGKTSHCIVQFEATLERH